MKIAREEFQKIPYLDHAVIGDRVVNLLPLWDGGKWHMWMPAQDKIIELKTYGLSHGDYVGQQPEQPTDLFIPFVNSIWQHASYIETNPLFQAICDDFHCMATSLEKLKHFHRTQKQSNSSLTAAFAATELQYICIVARGIFDLLQEIISISWNTKIMLLDPEKEKRRKARQLPTTFSKVVLKDKKVLRTQQEIMDTFSLPPKLAEEYSALGPFFEELRSIRDSIVHGFSELPMVFTTERGFCVHRSSKPYSRFEGWTEEHQYNENLVSILPWINNVISRTIDSCNLLMAAYSRQIQMLPPIAPDYQVFVRGLGNEALIDVKNGVVWWDLQN